MSDFRFEFCLGTRDRATTPSSLGRRKNEHSKAGSIALLAIWSVTALAALEPDTQLATTLAAQVWVSLRIANRDERILAKCLDVTSLRETFNFRHQAGDLVLRHSLRGRPEFVREEPDARHLHPVGQRRRNRYSRHASSLLNRDSSSASVRG
jgi:hypothetical protein